MSKKKKTPISSEPLLPKPVSAIAAGFGDISNLPPYDQIPDEFKNWNNPWADLAGRWFYAGLKEMPKIKEGIDANAALGAFASCLRSFAPKHEHKMAGVAYLMSIWCEPSALEIPAAKTAEEIIGEEKR